MATVIDFAGPDMLLLFTDGLIEHRGEIIDAGLARLSEASSTLLGRPLQPAAWTDSSPSRLRRRGEDDITAFALRRRCAD